MTFDDDDDDDDDDNEEEALSEGGERLVTILGPHHIRLDLKPAGKRRVLVAKPGRRDTSRPHRRTVTPPTRRVGKTVG